MQTNFSNRKQTKGCLDMREEVGRSEEYQGEAEDRGYKEVQENSGDSVLYLDCAIGFRGVCQNLPNCTF